MEKLAGPQVLNKNTIDGQAGRSRYVERKSERTREEIGTNENERVNTDDRVGRK